MCKGSRKDRRGVGHLRVLQRFHTRVERSWGFKDGGLRIFGDTPTRRTQRPRGIIRNSSGAQQESTCDRGYHQKLGGVCCGCVGGGFFWVFWFFWDKKAQGGVELTGIHAAGWTGAVGTIKPKVECEKKTPGEV